MTRITLICFFVLFQFKGFAQSEWIKNLHIVRDKSYYKDTIVVKFNSGVQLDSSIKLFKLDEVYPGLFRAWKDTLTEDSGGIVEKYLFSFYCSKSNFVIMVLYSAGMWEATGNLYLYNFSPEGTLLKQIKLQEGWGDAGESYFGNSKFTNDSTLNVVHGVGFEKADQSYWYAVTDWNYTITKEGRIIQNSVKEYEKKDQ